MHSTTDWNETSLPALGMGCWAIGGPFFAGDDPVGWGASDDDTSRTTIHAAYDAGLRLFDTAQAYGTGHSESLLGEVLADKPEARIVTKVGIGIDPATRQITGLVTDPAAIRAAFEESRKRLRRDVIDLALVHPNEFSVAEAAPVFDVLGDLHARGQIRAFGWSTDFPDKARAYADRAGFGAVEYAANVFFAGEQISAAVAHIKATALIRSPLAMGLLGGRITPDTEVPKDDVRARENDNMDWFTGRRMTPHYARRLDAIRSCLTVGGRTLAQGAIGWLWARHAGAIPVPGMRTPQQVADLCGALSLGPLPANTMAEIERLIKRPPEGPPRPR